MRFILCLLLIIVPSLAFDAQGASKLKIVQLSDTVYQHISIAEDDPYGMMSANGLIVINGQQAYLIDTPWTAADTENLIEWISLKGLTVNAAVITHFSSRFQWWACCIK